MRQLAAEADYPEMLARAEAVEAFVLQRTRDTDLAQARLRPAMEAFRLREELAETQIARIALAMVASDAGDRAAAADLLAAVQRVSSATQLDVWGLTALAVRARNAVCTTAAARPPTRSSSWPRSRSRGSGRTARAGSRRCRTACASARWPSSTNASAGPRSWTP